MRKQVMRRKWFKKALRQIQDKDYGYEFRQEGMKKNLVLWNCMQQKVCRAEVMEV